MAILMALGTQEPAPVRSLNPAVPEALAALIHQLLAKRAADRPASAAEVAERLRAVGDGPAAPGPARRKPRGKGSLLAGVAAMAMLFAGAVAIVFTNRDGKQTKSEAPPDTTVAIKDEDGRTITRTPPGGRTPVTDADRRAAEWALSLGGRVQVNGPGNDITAAADLPKGPFTLTWLNLSNTGITDAGLANLRGLEGLATVDLQYTDVGDAGVEQLKGLPALQYLVLGGTKVTDAGLAHLKGCTALATLSLSGLPITDSGLERLRGLKALTYLNLYRTKVRDAGLEYLQGLTGLTYLGLSYTAVTDAGLERLAGPRELKGLDLEGDPMTDAGLIHLKGCISLKRLVLSNTPISDAGLTHLKGLTGLTDLYLASTKVTDDGLAHLGNLRGLLYLNLKGANVTAGGVTGFHAMVPGCKIEYDGGIIEAVDADRKAAE